MATSIIKYQSILIPSTSLQFSVPLRLKCLPRYSLNTVRAPVFTIHSGITFQRHTAQCQEAVGKGPTKGRCQEWNLKGVNALKVIGHVIKFHLPAIATIYMSQTLLHAIKLSSLT